LCVLASPAFATPAVTITSAGLNAQGNWVWNVQIANTNPIPTGSSPLAAELGFKAITANLVSAANLSTGANDDFDTINPGTPIWGWEVLTDVDPDVGVNNKPVGVQTNCASGCTVNVAGNNPNSVFSALGSIDFNTVGPHDYIQIVTKGPTASSAGAATGTRKSSIQMLGIYGAGNVFGRISEALTSTTSTNFDTYAQQVYALATPGDTNLVGTVNLTDLTTVQDNFGIGTTWQQGNFHGNGTGVVNLTDLTTVQDAFGAASGGTGVGGGPGAGAGLSGGSVPEPASATLVLLGSLALVAKRRRK